MNRTLTRLILLLWQIWWLNTTDMLQSGDIVKKISLYVYKINKKKQSFYCQHCPLGPQKKVFKKRHNSSLRSTGNLQCQLSLWKQSISQVYTSVTGHSGRYTTSAEGRYRKPLRQNIRIREKQLRLFSSNVVDANECEVTQLLNTLLINELEGFMPETVSTRMKVTCIFICVYNFTVYFLPLSENLINMLQKTFSQKHFTWKQVTHLRYLR